MIIRVRSKEGMHRVDVEPTDDVFVLRNKLANVLSAYNLHDIIISRQPTGSEALDQPGVSFSDLGIKHGDMLYAQLLSKDAMSEVSKGKQPATSESVPVPVAKTDKNVIPKDPLDEQLERLDGRIPQKKDSRLCHHSKGVCTYCMPLEPYDEAYRQEKNIKHLSFHAYLKKLKTSSNQASAKQFSKWHGINDQPLEMPDYRVKPNCPNGHAPWPKSICSKCQPNAVTLKRQEFRMVDHVEFSSQMIINRFLDAWRQSGSQRFGWLYGRYERYDAVPLGIKAVVEAIYEPRQTDNALWVEVAGVEDPNFEGDCRADEVAAAVGMIWTDLTDDGLGKGGVICKRHVKSFFMSAQECQFAAVMQHRHKYMTSLSSSGSFGSRFVTCVVSGDTQNQIEVNAYQVSNEAMAMSEADLIEPSVEPSLLRVKPEAPGRYIPDVFYSRKNEYGSQESGSAKPCFPVEYWLVTLTHGAPTNPSPLFNDTHKFTIENRPLRREDAMELQQHFSPIFKNNMDSVRDLLADFHVLLSISNMAILDKEELAWIGKWIQEGDNDGAASIATLQRLPGWQTLMALLNEVASSVPISKEETHAPSSTGQGQQSSTQEDGPWQCPHCTFLNETSTGDCAMCGLPRL
ncbi:polyubiquitin-tagged protein recognition complex Npl4 component [Syncephalis plumigaleata]|nr:polyubiquitin-tagged protein recognition complex Npl4 component [Syncephalis plumigaleata]